MMMMILINENSVTLKLGILFFNINKHSKHPFII